MCWTCLDRRMVPFDCEEDCNEDGTPCMTSCPDCTEPW